MESSKRAIEWVEVFVGPVIGLVTNCDARILVKYKESDFQYQVQWNIKTEDEDPDMNFKTEKKYVICHLKGENGHGATDRKLLQINRPVVFTFKDLMSGVRYSVDLCEVSKRESSFCTLGKQRSGTLRTGVVSCNEISVQEEKKSKFEDLWADLGRKIRNNELDYLFHIGDQVYMDMEGDKTKEHVYHKCCEILRPTGGNVSQDVKDQVLGWIRGQYDRTWRDSSVAYVLANVPNLMICDDHEFRDDWGFIDDDSLFGTLSYDYGNLARQVYYEYQRQLREDIPWENLNSLKRKCEYHHHILNGVGVSFIEYRGCRSWFEEENLETTHIGEAQQKWLRSLYEEGGEFRKVSSSIFITPLPLFLLNNFISKGAYWINKVTLNKLLSDDIQEQWTYNAIPQLKELLDLLRRWKQRVPDRELLVVGGDFHLGGWTDVYYRGEKVFQQFITSAINNEEVNFRTKEAVEFLMRFGKLDKEYEFKHHDWRRENNYGIVEISKGSLKSSLTYYPK